MKRMLLLFGIALVTLPVRSEETAALDAAKQLVEAMNYCEMLESSLNEMKEAQTKQVQQMTGGISEDQVRDMNRTFELIREAMDCESMKVETAQVYADRFTADELRQLLAFYQSDLGQSLNRKQPEIMKRSMQISMERMNKVMPKIMQQVRQEKMKPVKPVPAPAN